MKKDVEKTAVNSQKARMFDLTTNIQKMAIDGKRNIEDVNRVYQEINDNPNFMAKFFPPDKSLQAQIESWQKLYKKLFGLKKDFSSLKIPEKKEGFDRLIIVSQGMTPNRIFNKIRELMPARKYMDDLDTIESVRKAYYHNYAIWIRDRVEADEELKNKSADDLAKEGVNGITLEERLLYELKYFQETGKHLDIQNITLCSGSRYSDDIVPFVYWYGDNGKIEVYWYYASLACDNLRSRQVVS